MRRSVIALIIIPILLQMAGNAFASALPTPTPAQRIGMEIVEPTQTPEPFNPSIVWPNRSDGNRPGGDGQSSGGSGADDQRQPPPTTPPRKETPPGEDNIPWEVEPGDFGQPVKPKRAKMKKMVGTYTVIVNDTKQALLIDGKSVHDFTLNFTAIKDGGGMTGSYVITGTLRQELVQFDDEYNVSFEYAGAGSLSGSIALVGPEEYKPQPVLSTEDDGLAPLVPENPDISSMDEDGLAPLKRILLRGSGSVYWAAATVKNRLAGIDGHVGRGGDWYPENVGLYITVYEDGSAIVELSVPGISSLYYKGRLVKNVRLVDVK